MNTTLCRTYITHTAKMHSRSSQNKFIFLGNKICGQKINWSFELFYALAFLNDIHLQIKLQLLIFQVNRQGVLDKNSISKISLFFDSIVQLTCENKNPA